MNLSLVCVDYSLCMIIQLSFKLVATKCLCEAVLEKNAQKLVFIQK